MTATTVKNTDVSNFDATPRVILESFKNNKAEVKTVVQTVATTSIDEPADVILLMALPSNACLHSLFISNADLDSDSALRTDIGIYNGVQPCKALVGSTLTKFAAYEVMNADGIVAASAQLSAVSAGAELITAGLANKRLWELAGLASDPNVMLVIGVTVTTAATSADEGTVMLRAIYANVA